MADLFSYETIVIFNGLKLTALALRLIKVNAKQVGLNECHTELVEVLWGVGSRKLIQLQQTQPGSLLLKKINLKRYWKKKLCHYTITLPLLRYQVTNKSNMTANKQGTTNPVIYAIKTFISKLRQNPDVYPIKYYKKSPRFRRNWKSPLVK